jgi:r-opsin
MSSNASWIIDEELSPNDPSFWSLPTPVDCNTIRILGIFLCIAAVIGIIFNGALFYSFARYKALRSPPNVFVMFIAGTGLFASCTILPLTGTSSIYCQWLYHRAGCQFGAIIAFLYGCSSSYLLCGVSLSRCYIIIRPFKAKDITVSR